MASNPLVVKIAADADQPIRMLEAMAQVARDLSDAFTRAAETLRDAYVPPNDADA